MSYHSQHNCGFIIPAIVDTIKESVETEKVESLLQQLSLFHVNSNNNLDVVKDDKQDFFMVLHNLLVRGEPTFLNFECEQEIVRSLGCFEETEKYGSLLHKFTGDIEIKDKLWQALHYVEPRLDKEKAKQNYRKSWEKLDSGYEEDFYYKYIPKWLKSDVYIQLFQSQRRLDTIVTNEKILRELRTNFQNQRTDFTLEFAYNSGTNSQKGICVEMDGPHHLEQAQEQLDNQRDNALLAEGWHSTVRFPVGMTPNDVAEKFETIKNYLKNEFVKTIKKNFEEKLYNSENGLKTLQLTLTPFGIARIQFVLIKSILSGNLSLDVKEWKIGIFEKDVPCANLAVRDFQRFFSYLSKLEGKNRKLPPIKLKVFTTNEFQNADLHGVNYSNNVSLISELSNEERFDLFIDISILERVGYSKCWFSNAATVVEVRSTHGEQFNKTKVLCGNKIKWRKLVREDQTLYKESSDALTKILQNIFRKKGFRTGQLPILNLALQNETVIGILPTGGGKSLTYQIACLLQPGVTIIIDPIKSLMKDQVDGLNRSRISRTVFINSMQITREERQTAIKKVSSGNVIFCFVSPERLQIKSFRNNLSEMYKDKIYFTYGVLDEVHCVSEWGHDFRTSYLALGKNLLRFCKSKEGLISLFGLTATASFDVTADIQRELSGDTDDTKVLDDNIVRQETINRNEIQYLVKEVEIDSKAMKKLEDKVDRFNKTIKNENTTWIDKVKEQSRIEWQYKEEVGKVKKVEKLNIIDNIDKIINNFQNNTERIISDEFIELVYENDKPTVSKVINQIQLLQDTIYNFWQQNGLNAGVIFAPHKSWHFGVTNKYKPIDEGLGIKDFLSDKLENLRFGTYMGTDSENDDQNRKTSEAIEIDNIRNQEDFINNKLDIMVCTKAFGMGIDKPNIRFTIHNNFPSSIESFVQEAGRAGRDRKMSVSIILYNRQKIQLNENKVLDNDLSIPNYFFHNSFKGIKKEKRIMYELLNEIHHPAISNKDILANKLAVKHPIENHSYQLNLSKDLAKYPHLWVNDSNKDTYGYIKLDKQVIRISNNVTVTRNLASNVLDEFNHLLKSNNAPLDNLTEFKTWFNKEAERKKVKGIEQVLDGISIGKSTYLTIPFTNNQNIIFDNIFEYLREIDDTIKKERVFKLLNEAKDIDDFIKKMYGNSPKELRDKLEVKDITEKEFRETLEAKMSGFRSKADTEKAIYRFMLIGLVDDYTVDFRTKTFEVTITKKTTEQYHQHLKDYISKFYSVRQMEQIIEGLKERKGNTEIQRILNFLTEFVYDEIAKKRKEAIFAMKELCDIGLAEGNIAMKTWIHIYFNSKYARSGYSLELDKQTVEEEYRTLKERHIGKNTYNCSLSDWTNKGIETNVDWIFDFMQITYDDYTSSNIANFKMLQGACTRLIIVQPDNYTLLFLRGFTRMMLAERQTIFPFDKIEQDLEKGFENLFKDEQYDRKPVTIFIHEYFDKILGYFNENQQEVREKISIIKNNQELTVHTIWTKRFAEKLSNELKPFFNV